MRNITDQRTYKDICNARWCLMSIMIYVVLGLLFWGEYTFNFIISYSLISTGNYIQGFLYILGWHIFFILNLVSYLRCVFTDPGSVPRDTQFMTYERRYVDDKEVDRDCKMCGVLKPDRSHHCRTCRTCVLKMDHHCPWVNNCVGWRNYKYFHLFLIYTSVLSLYYVFCTSPMLLTILGDMQRLSGNQLQVLIVYFVCVAFGLGLLGFEGQHISLTLKNKTTIESFDSKRSVCNPYDFGKLRNWEQVFGKKKLYWFLPFFTGIGNGYEFEVNGDIEKFNLMKPALNSKK